MKLIGEIREKIAEPFHFLFGKAETDFPGIASTGGRIMEGIDKHVKDFHIKTAGPVIWMYKHIGNGKVELKAGVPVFEDVQGSGFLKVEHHPEWRHMSAAYNGSMEKIGKAWDQFIEDVSDMGYAPKNINREVYLKWIAFDSEENVTELQVEVEKNTTPDKENLER